MFGTHVKPGLTHDETAIPEEPTDSAETSLWAFLEREEADVSGPCPVIVDLAFEETSRYVTCDIRRVCPALFVVFICCCCIFCFGDPI